MNQYLCVYKSRITNLLILSIIAYYTSADSAVNNRALFIFLSIANAIILGSIALLTSKQKALSAVFICFISLAISFEVTYVNIFSSRITFEGITAMLDPNINELGGLSYILKKGWFIFVIIFCIIAGSFFFATKEQNNKKIATRYLAIILITPTLLVSLEIIKIIFSKTSNNIILKNELYNNPFRFASDYCFHWSPSFFNTCSLTFSYFEEVRKFKKILSEPQNYPNSLWNEKCTGCKIPATIFIIIGNNSNRKNWSLYGYQTPTTPYIDSLYNKNKLLVYNALSPASTTKEAIPLSLSFGTPFKPNNSIKEKSIINLAKDSGYETYWFSDPNMINTNGRLTKTIISQFDNIVSGETSEIKQTDDLNIIAKIKRYFDPKKKQLFVIMLRGSYQPYQYDAIDAKNINQSNSFNRSFLEYDRTIHHTDRLLGSLYSSFFENEKSDSINRILFYYSADGNFINENQVKAGSSIDQLKIPFIIIGSSFFYSLDNLMLKYTQNNIFNSSNFPYVFSEIIGYKVKDEASKKAKNEGLYYKKTTRKVIKFPDNID